MMEQRTLNIIYLCKRHSHKYWDGAYSHIDAIKNYMADECAYEAEWYTDKDMLDIMWDAMSDYLNHCDRPSAFMWQLKNVIDVEPNNLPERIAVAFSLVQVRDNGNYVNGFDDRLHKLDRENTK
jgi:hypothetical protein